MRSDLSPWERCGRARGRFEASTHGQSLLVPRLEVALAVIAALRTARRAVAVGLGLVAGARLLAAGALHQHAAALAVSDQTALAGGLERLFAARSIGRFGFPLCGRLALHRPVEIPARERSDLFSELIAPPPGLYPL